MHANLFYRISLGMALILLLANPVFAEGNVYAYPGQMPNHIKFSPDHSTIYASIVDGIGIIDKSTMGMEVVNLDHRFIDIEIDPNGSYLYGTQIAGASGNGRIARLNLTTHQMDIIDVYPVNVFELTLDDCGDYLYVSGGTWPNVDEGVDFLELPDNLNTGRIFEIRTSDFTLIREATLGVYLRSGLSYKDGKLVVMSPEMRLRQLIGSSETISGTSCYVIDASSLSVDMIIPVPGGERNSSYLLPGIGQVISGFNCEAGDGVGLGIINVLTGEAEQWILTEPDWLDWQAKTAGGPRKMAIDAANNILYSTMYAPQDKGQPDYEFGVFDLTTYEYQRWGVEPFRPYFDILFDPVPRDLYLSVPDEDSIVVLSLD